jgi:AcrR family transcriptional regulator
VIDRQVLDAARACFLASGFDGTSMEAIAERARVTKVTLYLRYPDKIALLRAVMHERIVTWSQISDQRVVSKGETLDLRLRHYARSILRWSRVEEVRAFGKLIRGCWGTAQVVADEMQAIRVGRMRELLASDIVTFSADEGLSPRAPLEIADIYLGMLNAFSAPAELSEDEAAPLIAAFADRVVDILLRGRAAW